MTIVELWFHVRPRIDTVARVYSFQYLSNRISALNGGHHPETAAHRKTCLKFKVFHLPVLANYGYCTTPIGAHLIGREDVDPLVLLMR